MRFVFALIFMLLVARCDVDRLYERNIEFDKKVWYVDSIPTFEFNIAAPTQEYDVYLNLRNSMSYPFQNIYITYFLEDSIGNELSTDLVNFQLFDTKTGEPYGEGGIGDIYDHRFKLIDNLKLPEEGGYRIRLQQYMRRDSLPEIMAVGIRVEQNKNDN